MPPSTRPLQRTHRQTLLSARTQRRAKKDNRQGYHKEKKARRACPELPHPPQGIEAFESLHIYGVVRDMLAAWTPKKPRPKKPRFAMQWGQFELPAYAVVHAARHFRLSVLPALIPTSCTAALRGQFFQWTLQFSLPYQARDKGLTCMNQYRVA